MNESARTVCETAFPRHGALERMLRSRLTARLSGLQGRLVLEDPWGRLTLGQPESGAGRDVQVQVLDPAFYRALATHGSVGVAQAYIEGQWRCGDLVDLFRLLIRNRAQMDALEGGTARWGGWLLRAANTFKRNSLAGASRNIAAHYDLGNDFFGLFLSPDLMYSSALWEGEKDTLELASARKLEQVCRKLDLHSSDHLCEIGSGWGGLAFYAAKNHGCLVTTITISREQHAWVSRRLQEQGLGERVRVLLSDYRQLQGQYDKLASIEMIEAVGAAYLPQYFATLSRLLKPAGRALIQAITIEDHRYAQALTSVDFIKRYIFPGSFIPSVQAILTAKMQSSDLALMHFEDFADSYARTLNEWRTRFLAHLPQVRALGFDDGFIRMWEYYLAYCEGGFRERSIGVAHLLFEKPRNAPAADSAAKRW